MRAAQREREERSGLVDPLGPWTWNATEAAHLSRMIGYSDADRFRARTAAALCDLHAALATVVNVVDHAPAGFRNGPLQHLTRYADDFARRTLAEPEMTLAGVPDFGVALREADPRFLLVVALDKPGLYWWLDRRPKARELATLSILAGNRPQVTIPAHGATTADMIEAEARILQHLVKRHRPKSTE